MTMNVLRTCANLLLVNLVAALLPSSQLPFTTKPCRVGSSSCSHGARSVLHMSTMDFKGEAASSLSVSLPPGVPSSRSLPEWLNHPDSDGALLGTKEFTAREDGLWDCAQPTIGWFGLKLAPVFVNRIDKSSEQVVVSVVDARTDILSGRVAGSVISKVMEQSTFVGNHAVTWRQAGEGDWTLSSEFSLTLLVPLPRLVLLPPGFNMVGSQIVQTTCRSRVEQNLEDLRDAYLEWASLPHD